MTAYYYAEEKSIEFYENCLFKITYLLGLSCALLQYMLSTNNANFSEGLPRRLISKESQTGLFSLYIGLD